MDSVKPRLSRPAHLNHRVGILDYVDMSHPEHHVKHVDQVLLVQIAFGVFEILDVIDGLLVRLIGIPFLPWLWCF